MPAVPYSPVPSVEPQDIPAPGFHPSIPADAFGVNIGRAVEHMGTTLDQVGGELWQRAVDQQNLKNETESTAATANYELQARQRQVDYTTKQQGLNAVNGLPGEMQAQDDLRQSFRNGLSNPAAQRMFDRSSLFIMNRELGIIGSHAATQNRVAFNTENKNAMETALDSLMQNPTPDNLGDTLERIGPMVQKQAVSEGLDPVSTARMQEKAMSAAKAHFIEGVSHTDPQKANAYFEANRKSMTYEDIKRLENIIPARNRQVASRVGADAIQEGWQPYMTPSQRHVMDGVATPLTSIVQEAQRILAKDGKEVVPISGFRSNAEQRDIWGRSHEGRLFAAAPPGSSRHEVGLAVDLQPQGSTTYGDVQRAMYQASSNLGIPLSDEHARLGARDRPHYSLPRDYDVGSAPKPTKPTLQQQVDTGKQWAFNKFPNDPAMPDEVEARIRGNFHASDQLNRQTIQDNMNILEDGMINRGDGQPAQNMDDLLHLDSKRQQAYDTLVSMDPGKAATWPARINTYNRSMIVHSDPQLLNRMDGMRASDPDEFQKQDFIGDQSLQMGQRDRRTYWNFQQTDKKAGAGDTVVRRALALPDIKAMIKTADPNISLTGPSDEKENYYDFVGALKGAIDYETQRNNGKPPSDDELREIAKKELYGRAVTKAPWFTLPKILGGASFGGGTSQEPIYNVGKTLSDSEREEVKQKLMKQNPNGIITDRDIDIQAAKDLYERLKLESKVPKLGG